MHNNVISYIIFRPRLVYKKVPQSAIEATSHALSKSGHLYCNNQDFFLSFLNPPEAGGGGGAFGPVKAEILR